jgi:hypothetical protein
VEVTRVSRGADAIPWSALMTAKDSKDFTGLAERYSH